MEILGHTHRRLAKHKKERAEGDCRGSPKAVATVCQPMISLAPMLGRPLTLNWSKPSVSRHRPSKKAGSYDRQGMPEPGWGRL